MKKYKNVLSEIVVREIYCCPINNTNLNDIGQSIRELTNKGQGFSENIYIFTPVIKLSLTFVYTKFTYVTGSLLRALGKQTRKK